MNGSQRLLIAQHIKNSEQHKQTDDDDDDEDPVSEQLSLTWNMRSGEGRFRQQSLHWVKWK